MVFILSLVSKKNWRDCGKIPQEGTILILEHIEATVPDHTTSDWRALSGVLAHLGAKNGAF
jgi:hypothetical protein